MYFTPRPPPPKKSKKSHAVVSYAPSPQNARKLPCGICVPAVFPNLNSSGASQREPPQPHGHVKLLVLPSLFNPSSSPLTCLGTLALAQHCSATRLMSSTSSSLSLSWRFASLLLRSLTPFSSGAVPVATNGTRGCVDPRF